MRSKRCNKVLKVLVAYCSSHDKSAHIQRHPPFQMTGLRMPTTPPRMVMMLLFAGSVPMQFLIVSETEGAEAWVYEGKVRRRV